MALQRLLKLIKCPLITLTELKRNEELQGKEQSENQLKMAAGLKKDFATVFNKDNVGDKSRLAGEKFTYLQ